MKSNVTQFGVFWAHELLDRPSNRTATSVFGDAYHGKTVEIPLCTLQLSFALIT